MVMAIICAAVAAAIVALVVLVALCGWAGRIGVTQRIGLSLIASGLLWAGPGRFQGHPPGLGDLLMLVGVLVYALAVYGRQLADHLDAVDGRLDGRIALDPAAMAQAFRQATARARNRSNAEAVSRAFPRRLRH